MISYDNIQHSFENACADKKRVERYLIIFILMIFCLCSLAQTPGTDQIFTVKSEFSVSVKDAVKLSDVPEIEDSVKRITNIPYSITTKPIFPKYETQTIQPAKLQNEPLPRLYHSLLKTGYSPFYNMPYAEFWISNARAREQSYGARLKHFSSTTHLRDAGYGGFSNNEISVFGKKFYKKHTLSGEFNYERNVVHYYGFDTTASSLSNDFTRQRYQLFDPHIRLQSHYTDSTHINHDVRLSFYNLQNLHGEAENNIRAAADASMFLNKEKLNVTFLTDYYNHKQRNDTLNDLIISLGPSFSAGNRKWHADIGITGTLDNFRNKSSFYFYPQLYVHYDIYKNLIVPYAGVSGRLIKNSMRTLVKENPFVDTTLNYGNTDSKYIYGGLKGKLSSKTSYDVKATYSMLNNMYFYVIDYGGDAMLYNQFDVVYDNTTLLNLSGQLQYQVREKLNVIAKGNYFLYKPKNLVRPYHKPEFDMTFSAIYNIASKIIVRGDLFITGKQWALSRTMENSDAVLKPKVIEGWADLNLEAEYRYSKMLSFFVRANNIANQRYYRWERYPTQRFSMMIGLSFVPF